MADVGQSLENATSALQKVADSLLAAPQTTQAGFTALHQAQQSQQQFQSGWAQPLIQQQSTLLQRLQLARTELEVVRAQSRLDYYRTPGSALLSRARLAAQAQLDTIGKRTDTAQMRTELDWVRSPGGQRALKDQAAAEKERASIARELETQKRLAGMSGMERFNKAIVDGARGVQRFGGTLQMAMGTLMSLAGKASPTHVATLSGSMDMVSARLGKVLLPVVEETARALQGFARMLDSSVGKAAIAGTREALRLGYTAPGTHIGAPQATASWGRWFGELGFQAAQNIRGMFGMQNKATYDDVLKKQEKGWWGERAWAWMQGGSSASQAPLKPSLAAAGAPQEMSADRYQVQLMMSGLMMGRDTTEADVQREQWKEMAALLKGIGQEINKVEHNTRPGAFR